MKTVVGICFFCAALGVVCADEIDDKIQAQKIEDARLERQRQDQKIWDQKREDARLEQKREDARRLQRKYDDERWERQHSR